MTPAERQRRRRKRLKKERSAEWHERERLTRREKRAMQYMPMPPGITYWRKAKVRTTDGHELETSLPVTKPLPSLNVAELDNADLVTLLRQMAREAIRRGLLNPGEPIPVRLLDRGAEAADNVLQAAETRELGPGEGCTIGPRP